MFSGDAPQTLQWPILLEPKHKAIPPLKSYRSTLANGPAGVT